MKSSDTHLVIDIETLSRRSNPAVIAIGSVFFTLDEIIDTQLLLLDPRFTPGHRDEETLQWWTEQDLLVSEEMMSGNLYPSEACTQFNDFLISHLPHHFWGNSPRFDMEILTSLFSAVGVSWIMNYKAERDFRTLRKVADWAGIDYHIASEGRRLHHALDDAMSEARAIQLILNRL